MAGPVIDMSSYYLASPNREAVKLNDNKGNFLCAIADAKRLRQDVIERMPSHGEYIGTDVDFRLPATQVDTEVLPGYFILDANNVAYTVIDTDAPHLNSVWMCNCLALRVLGHTVQIYLPTDLTDSANSPITDQSKNIPVQSCAIQETGEEEIIFQGVVQGLRRKYSIWLLSEPRIDTGAILKDERGYVYSYDSLANRRNINELVEVLCHIDP